MSQFMRKGNLSHNFQKRHFDISLQRDINFDEEFKFCIHDNLLKL